MTVATEQNSVKYKGGGKSAEGFPIPFSFRHADILKVRTIDTADVATSKTSGVDYTLVQRHTRDESAVVGTVRAEYGWITWIGTSPTDIIHIYKEETLLQAQDYGGSSVIDSGAFEISKDRVIDSTLTQISRNAFDPSTFSAEGNKMSSSRTPIHPDELLNKGVLDDMQTTASLTIPTSGTSGQLLDPRTFAPSTPSVAWGDKLAVPGGSSTNSVLSPVADYANPPYVEWTAPRWVTYPEINGLRYVYSYGTGDEVEGTNETKSVRWREFREMLDLPTIDGTPPSVAAKDDVVRLKNTTWVPPNGPVSGTPSYAYESVAENSPPGDRSENQINKRVLATNGGEIVYSPRFEQTNITVNVRFDGGDYVFGEGDGTQQNPSNLYLLEHPVQGFSITNALRDDSNNLYMPQMVFLQVFTTAEDLGGGHTAYPVFSPTLDSIDNTEHPPGHDDWEEWLVDDDAPNNTTINGSLVMMNRNQFSNADTSGSGNAVGSNDYDDDTTYLDWTGNKSIGVRMLTVFDSAAGLL